MLRRASSSSSVLVAAASAQLVYSVGSGVPRRESDPAPAQKVAEHGLFAERQASGLQFQLFVFTTTRETANKEKRGKRYRSETTREQKDGRVYGDRRNADQTGREKTGDRWQG